MVAAIRGRSTPVVAVDTDTNVIAVPTGKEFRCTRVLLSNNGVAATRVRVWDTFTEVDGTVHSTSLNEIVVVDRNLNGDETAEPLADILSGLFTGLGTLVAQATVAGAFPNDVTVGLWGFFE